ncbi:MAG: Calx-beta domain-containing protein, partial [Comamonas sp.]|nr:Calx-beta domain-containing protein [Comamonas sp.]
MIVSAHNLIVSESDGYAEFTVRLSAPASSPITVKYNTPGGSASYYSPADYVNTYGTLTFAVGTTTQTVRVPLNDDITVEDTESFYLELHTARDASGNVVKIANNKLIATIIDNDT